VGRSLDLTLLPRHVQVRGLPRLQRTLHVVDGPKSDICGSLPVGLKNALALANPIEGDIGFGLALHVGEVLYGNIGSGNRLDFTCIGPAVNLAARIEKLTSELGRTILASDEFARHCSSHLVPVGEFELRGFGVARAVFGLAEEGNPTEQHSA
jgi:class 3 adenylate cyclase